MKNIIIAIGIITGIINPNAAPIHKAAEAGDINAIKSELDKGVDVNLISDDTNVGWQPLHFALSKKGNKELIQFLISKGSNVNAVIQFYTPLQLVIKNGLKIEILQILLDAGADVNGVSDNSPFTALHFACGYKSTSLSDDDKLFEAVELLIENGANLNASLESGYPPIRAARTIEIKKLLIENGARLNFWFGREGATLLHTERDIEILHILLKKGIDINIRDKRDNASALHYAVYKGSNFDKVEFLLKYGANPNAKSTIDVNSKNKYGTTPLDWLYTTGNWRSENFKKIETLLLDYGAKRGSTIIEDQISELNVKISELERLIASDKHKNPKNEWPRKVWELDLSSLNLKKPFYAEFVTIANDGKTILLNFTGTNAEGASERLGLFMIRYNGDYFQLTDNNSPHVRSDQIIYMSKDSLVVKDRGHFSYKVKLYHINNNNVIVKQFEQKVQFPPTSGKGIPQSSHLAVQIKEGTNTLILWDYTPPNVVAVDQDNGNTIMNRLMLNNSGNDITISIDGNLNGKAELQMSNDLKNWLKINDISLKDGEVLLTPKKDGNEFYRLKINEP